MAKIKRSANTVSIACKLPQGLTIHLKDGPVVKLHGAHSHYNVGGYGITQGVPVGHWEAIKKEHAHALWLKNEFVFANGDSGSVEDEADEKAGLKNGFEPIDPNKPDARGMIQPDGADDLGM